MLHRAIEMAESLGLVNSTKKLQLVPSHYSKDMARSLKRTVWGLFQIDTCVTGRTSQGDQVDFVPELCTRISFKKAMSRP